MSNNKILSKASAGNRVAEQDSDGLKNYFQKTYIWDGIIDNETDIIFGCKGSGKSAIYSYLTSYSYDLIGENTILVPAVNPRGTAAFKDLQANPPTGEVEFNHIWKLYFILIIAQKLNEFKQNDQFYQEVIEKLQESNLLPRSYTFPAMLKMVRDYILKINPSFEPRATFNEQGSVDGVGCKIILTEPSSQESDKGIVSLDYLFNLINKSLETNGNKVWLSIDRLDVVFIENLDLEVNALRALFKVYIDLQEYDNLRLIIFLRDDIWNRIIEKGFRELSHVTKVDTIIWDEDSLFDLLMDRLIENQKILEYYELDKKQVNKTKGTRLNLYNKLFAEQIGSDRRHSFKWMVHKLSDGNGNCSPRELIHLVNESIKAQAKMLKNGISLEGKSLISENAIKAGFKESSKVKFNTLIAEYPDMSKYLHRLKKKKVRMSLDDLKTHWDISKKASQIMAKKLIQLGFFKNESEDIEKPSILIPELYRPALNIN